MNNDKPIIILIFVTLVLSFLSMLYLHHEFDKPEIEIRTDTIIKHDTLLHDTIIKDTVPTLKYRTIIKIDTLFQKDNTPVELITESKQYKDTLTCNEKDSVILTSYISGINSKLDSTTVNLKKQEIIKTVTITNEITKTITKKNKRFAIAPFAGVGYGFFSKKIEPVIGVGVAINI